MHWHLRSPVPPVVSSVITTPAVNRTTRFQQKSDNARLFYCDLTIISNLSIVRQLCFNRKWISTISQPLRPHNAPMHQIWANSVNARLRYWRLNKFISRFSSKGATGTTVLRGKYRPNWTKSGQDMEWFSALAKLFYISDMLFCFETRLTEMHYGSKSKPDFALLILYL